MDDLESLYKQVIMEHYKYPHNKGLIDNESYKKVHLNNPSCGDDITVQFIIEDNVIKDILFDGEGAIRLRYGGIGNYIQNLLLLNFLLYHLLY